MAPIRPFLRASGVTDQQWRVLRVLSDDGPLDASGIAERALLYAPSVTRIVRELVERGLLSRSGDEGDRRRSVISITSEGQALVRRTAEHTAIVLDRYTETFGRDRLAHFIAEATALTEVLAQFAPSETEASQDER